MGYLLNGSSIYDRQIHFDWQGAAEAPSLRLPAGLLKDYKDLTLEMWVSLDDDNDDYNRIFTFCADRYSESRQQNTLFMYRDKSSGLLSMAWYAVVNPFFYVTKVPFNNQRFLHIAITFQVNLFSNIYSDGQFSYKTTKRITVNDALDNYNFLGRSCDGKTGLKGSIDEFRIWKGLLSSKEIAHNRVVGSDGDSCAIGQFFNGTFCEDAPIGEMICVFIFPT
jgi:hypothetical protein